MKNLFYFFTFMILLSLYSCVKVLNDDLKTKETKMVLNAAISPDSLFKVNISRTFNIFEDESANNLPFIDDATVNLYEDGEFLSKLNSIGYGYYINPGFYPEIDKEYKIEASYGSLHNIESWAVIPQKVFIKDFDTTTIKYNDEYSTYHDYIGIITYDDPKGVDNQYLLSCKVGLTDNMGKTYWNDQYLRPVESDERFFDSDINGKLLWNDKFTNGKEVTFRFVFYTLYNYKKLINREAETIKVQFSLQTVSKDYYTYLKSYGIYLESGGGEDPFSEPVVIHSNVENGYGIFGGYSQDTVNTTIVYTYDGGTGGGK